MRSVLANNGLQSAGAQIIPMLGVDYLRLNTADGGDLYLTPYECPFEPVSHLRIDMRRIGFRPNGLA
jgi:hypothetical protein